MHAEHSGPLEKLKLGWGGLNCCCCRNSWSPRFAVLKGGFLFVFRSRMVSICTTFFLLKGCEQVWCLRLDTVKQRVSVLFLFENCWLHSLVLFQFLVSAIRITFSCLFLCRAKLQRGERKLICVLAVSRCCMFAKALLVFQQLACCLRSMIVSAFKQCVCGVLVAARQFHLYLRTSTSTPVTPISARSQSAQTGHPSYSEPVIGSRVMLGFLRCLRHDMLR